MVLVTVAGTTYSVDKRLHKKWATINNGQLAKEDDDRVFVVDGRERSGKSLFTLQQAGAIDPLMFEEALATQTLPVICFTAEETLNAIRNTKSTLERTRVIIFDEAFRGLASSSVLSKTNRMIVQALMEMGQNNLVLFIVLPSFFLLDRYPAALRSHALIHIAKMKSNPKRRKFYVFNYDKKNLLYRMDRKKAYGYPINTRVHGTFFNKYPGGDALEALYRRKKLEAFREIESTLTGDVHETRAAAQRDYAIYLLKEKTNMTLKELSKLFSEVDINFRSDAISKAICRWKDHTPPKK